MSTFKTIPAIKMSRIKELIIEKASMIQMQFAVDKPSTLQLDVAVQKAHEEWQQALQEMDYIDGDLAEYAIYKLNAAERRYIALLNQARKEGITAWPDTFSPVCVNDGICSN